MAKALLDLLRMTAGHLWVSGSENSAAGAPLHAMVQLP